MYAVHTTPGFIIESRPSGEAGRVLSIFTRELGLIRATALGIRLEKSKLRYHSAEYSFGQFSFVRGKEYWRLTNASELPHDVEGQNVPYNEIVVRVALLLRRLLHGEDAHPELFDEIQSAASFFEKSSGLTPDQLQTLESLLVYRILSHLGYIGTDKNLNTSLFDAPVTTELITESAVYRKILNAHINKALKESHL